MGKEKEDKKYIYWRFFRIPTLSYPNRQNRGIEVVGDNNLQLGFYINHKNTEEVVSSTLTKLKFTEGSDIEISWAKS